MDNFGNVGASLDGMQPVGSDGFQMVVTLTALPQQFTTSSAGPQQVYYSAGNSSSLTALTAGGGEQNSAPINWSGAQQ